MEGNSTAGPHTPVNKSSRKLGVRRSALKRSSTSLSALSESEITPHLPKRKSKAVTPVALHEGSSASITTPLQNLCVPRRSASTGQYKLTLSRRVRDNFKKKRLDFLNKSATNTDESKENIQENFSTYCLEDCGKPSNLTKSSEARVTPEKPAIFDGDTRNKLKSSTNDWDERVKQLKNAIMVWKTAFKRALDDLSAKLNIDSEETLKKLHIPDEMTKYLEDNEI